MADGIVKRGAAWVLVQFFLFGVYLALPWRPPQAAGTLSAAGYILIGLGAWIFLAGLAALGRGLTPFPVPSGNSRLVTRGAFAWVRHPLYSGLISAAFGWALAAHDRPRLILSGVLFIFFNAKAAFEEKVLAERFPDYAEYARRVKRFFPFIY